MCGITGVYAFNAAGAKNISCVEKATEELALRGPDTQGVYKQHHVCLGHTRLSVIDVSIHASQPFTDASGRYTIVFNGEFYNFKTYRNDLIQKGYPLRSKSDTEVLLYLYINEGISCVEKINGFFSFAIYDKHEDTLVLCRDRLGIKPLYYYKDDDAFIFGSEMKAMMSYNIPREIDKISLYSYLQLNYIPAPHSILTGVRKLEPGCFIEIKQGHTTYQRYYKLPYKSCKPTDTIISYQEAQRQLQELLESAVSLRMVSDVPLGAFLSGGIDSSIIVALASRHTSKLKTFSIGFKDEKMFDETHYADMVASHFKTEHKVFSLTNDDLLGNLFKVLDYTDEPFADSSALAVHILSMHTRRHVTVTLSGDGADEMFAGYNKHRAEYWVRRYGAPLRLLSGLSPLLALLPQGRHNSLMNKFRQAHRLLNGARLNAKERYWLWAALADEKESSDILKYSFPKTDYEERKNKHLEYIDANSSCFNEVLYTDMHLVLANDMLPKVDLMSMANSLEVRVPFLDYRLAAFAFSLPPHYKIDKKGRKNILRDAYKNLLPDALYTRKKHGFEVPLLKWFRKELKSYIADDLLAEDFLEAQNIFCLREIAKLKKQLFSKNPGDVHARIWALLVFQYWYKKYFK